MTAPVRAGDVIRIGGTPCLVFYEGGNLRNVILDRAQIGGCEDQELQDHEGLLFNICDMIEALNRGR